MSKATENFVKTIYRFQQQKGSDTKPGSVAKSLGITSAAATDMARKLSEKNIVDYTKYQELKLTEEGKKIALNVLRKHRLWESFLFKTFNLSLHEIHREAELLEHQTSDFLADKLSSYLGNPSIDPHGDPIPNANGEVSVIGENVSLSQAEAGTDYLITRLFSTDKEFFDFCQSSNLTINSVLSIKNQYQKNKITEIKVGEVKLFIHADFANHIYVKQINQ
jgi:DtxR family Mn-dependent transcriptional regulator